MTRDKKFYFNRNLERRLRLHVIISSCLQTSWYNNIVYNQWMSHKEKNIKNEIGSQIDIQKKFYE